VFLAATEADVHPGHRRRVLDGAAGDTVLTADLFDVGWPDAPHRTLRGATFAEWDAHGRPPSGQRPGEGTSIGWADARRTAPVVRYSAFMPTGAFDGDIDQAPLWAGTSVDHVHVVEPAAAIIARLDADASAALASSRGEIERGSGPPP
jgi:NAD(P)H-dependent flavin oxidoreductase YrpB (nitropropane dioxygenase family)